MKLVVVLCGVWLSLCVCVRLASRVCVCLASASVSRLRLSRVCVCLASRICLACVSRLSASVHVKGSECVRLVRLRLSRVCLRLFTSRVPNACVLCVCVCLASVSRRSSCLASVRLHLSRVCLASVVLSRVGRLVSRVSVSPCECLRELAHFMRRSSFKEFKRFLLSSYYRCTYRLCRLYEQTFNILI